PPRKMHAKSRTTEGASAPPRNLRRLAISMGWAGTPATPARLPQAAPWRASCASFRRVGRAWPLPLGDRHAAQSSLAVPGIAHGVLNRAARHQPLDRRIDRAGGAPEAARERTAIEALAAQGMRAVGFLHAPRPIDLGDDGRFGFLVG